MKNNKINVNIINNNATNSVKLQEHKRSLLNKVAQEINKIEEDIKILEQNKN